MLARWSSSIVLIVILSSLGTAAAHGNPTVPRELAGWKDWVLEGHEHLNCPFRVSGGFGEPEEHLCAWPARLRLEAADRGGSFSITWRVFERSWLPLPGGARTWPLEVRVDGSPRPVVERGGAPAVQVGSGRHRIDGRFSWARRPESLAIPKSLALIDLRIDGQVVFPLQRTDTELWLGRAEAVTGQADALSFEVYRRLVDGLPPMLETRLRFEVSGQGREELVGPVLPDGFVPMGVLSELQVILDGDGRLRLQLRPGNWQVVVTSRALAPLQGVDLIAPSGVWPASEVWSYQAAHDLRMTAASGGLAVDPSQVDVPAEWNHLPAFTLADGDRIDVEERSRGRADDANRLQLTRELWLDFSGAGMTARDTVTGRMVKDFRLDVTPPFVLQRAQAGGQPLLVTRGAGTGATGVELRNPLVHLEATSRVTGRGGSLPVTGWSTSFEGVTTTVHLPPGRELLAALGADSSPQAWIDRWSLLDVFLVLITTLLTGHLLDRRWATVMAAFLTLGYHQSVGPLWALLLLISLLLIRRGLPEGRLETIVKTACGSAIIVLALVVLPFAADQLRLALYPQLEQHMVGSWSGPSGLASYGLAADMQAEPEPMPREEIEEKVAWADADLSRRGAPKRQLAQRLQRYQASNVFQAGGGEPAWSWRQARLGWSGPVQPEQRLRLLLTPVWLTRVLRVVLVTLLAALIGPLVRDLTVPRGGGGALAAGVLLLLVGAGLSPVSATTPDPELLSELEKRLTRAPECVPQCGSVERAVVQVDRAGLAVSLTVHASELVGFPMPSSETVWRISQIKVDGETRAEMIRADGGSWLAIERGVHRIDLSGELAAVDSLELRFPMPVGRLEARGSGWDFSGIRDGGLLTDTLGLVRVRDAGAGPAVEAAAVKVPPFVRVTRMLDLDLDWSVTTTVMRVAPASGSFTAEVPLLVGESVLTPGFEERDGGVTVALAAGVQSAGWSSRLEPVDRLEIEAADLVDRSETWQVTVSPQWRARFTGPPPTHSRETTDFWVHEFHPLPEESLLIEVSRPDSVAGATLAIDSADLVTQVGLRASEHRLELSMRSTRGGQHTLGIPAEAEILEVAVDGTALNVRPDQGRLTLPVHPGEQHLVVRWRDEGGVGPWVGTPEVDLGASASNLTVRMTLSANRWLLWTSGPRVGPAVIYWNELIVMALLALLLARLGWTPLRLHQWLLLGIGFSTFSWFALALFVVWLLALEARGRFDLDLSWWRFDLMQLFLVTLTAAAVICVLVAIPYGLLGAPDMHVVGNGSSATSLRWFSDLSDGEMPASSAASLPLIVYRMIMLVWALWLATSIIGWLRWGWQCLTQGGGWKRRAPKVGASRAKTATSSLETDNAEA